MERTPVGNTIKDEAVDFGLHGESYKSPRESAEDLFPEHEVLQMQFDAEEDAHAFFNAYARISGFSVRKDKLRKAPGLVVSRRWVCSRQGYRSKVHSERTDRKRSPRSLTRTGCAVQFSILYDKNIGKYKVSRFLTKHNHQCASSTSTPFLRSHRSISNPIKAQIASMRAVGVQPSQIMDYIKDQYGTHANVGFIKKDLQNHIQEERNLQISDGDAEAAFAYFCAKRDSDPLFFYKYAVGEHNKLDKLFWCDAICRSEYAAFGDVLVFDTTYRTNAYRKPFVLLAGINNHFQSTIYACALLVDETVASYKWVLSTLLEAMDHKAPLSVVTDGDRAMREAIKVVFPDARHRLCSWHLHRNAMTNVPVPGFCEQFKQLMSLDEDEAAFEEGWSNLIKKHGLETNSWISETYDNRGMWAEAYLRGHFFAGVKSTQRCEGMHSFFKPFLPLKLKLFEFVRHFDRAMCRMRNNESFAHATTENTDPVLTTPLRRLEKNASRVYTRNIFFKFRDEIIKSCTFFVSAKKEDTYHREYTLSKWTVVGSKWEVLYYPSRGTLRCSCKKFESVGIPCCHMIAVMKCEHLTELPASCVLLRWTPAASKHCLKQIMELNVPASLSGIGRYGVLSACFRDVCYYASLTSEGFDEACNLAAATTQRMKQISERSMCGHDDEKRAGPVLHGINDPDKVTTKGNPGLGSRRENQKTPRRCGGCSLIGHTRRTCPKLASASRGISSKTYEGACNNCDVPVHPVGTPPPSVNPPPITPKRPSVNKLPRQTPIKVRRSLFCRTVSMVGYASEPYNKNSIQFDIGSQNAQAVQNSSFTVDAVDQVH